MRLSCTVCYEIFSPSDSVWAAPCGHILHRHCWFGWLGRHRSCPECREPVQTAHLLRLYFSFDPEEGDYSTLSTKYITLKYGFDRKNKEVEMANAALEKQKSEIEKLQFEITQLKAQVGELQKIKNEEDVIPPPPAYNTVPYPPNSYMTTTSYNVVPPMPNPAWPYTGNGTSLPNTWTSTRDGFREERIIEHVVTNVSLLKDSETSSSPRFMIANLPWTIRIIPRTKPDPGQSDSNGTRWLGFFLQCNVDAVSTTWSCYATAGLRILPQMEGVPVFERKIQHLYYHSENDWGFRHFVRMSDVLNPAQGYIKYDTIRVQVHVEADSLHGVASAHRLGSACAPIPVPNDNRKRLRPF